MPKPPPQDGVKIWISREFYSMPETSTERPSEFMSLNPDLDSGPLTQTDKNEHNTLLEINLYHIIKNKK